MSKMQELKKLIAELHAAGNDERLDVEQYVELCMAKLEIAHELAQYIPDSLSVNPPSAEEAAAVDAAITSLLESGRGEIDRIMERGQAALEGLRQRGYPVGEKDRGK